MRSSVFLRIIILIILFSFNFFYSQQNQLASIEDVVKVTLGKGVKIYSTDPSFNEQIIQQKIIVENAEVTFKKSDKHRILVASSSHRSKPLNLSQQVKSIEENRKKEELNKVKEKIDSYEAKSESFPKHDYQESPTPSQFSSSHSTLKSYVAPSHNTNVFSKIYTADKNYSIKRALDFLHTQQFTFYNNKSFDYCYSQVYSVRPPPVLVL